MEEKGRKPFWNEIDRFMSFINCVDVYFFPESQMSHFLFELDQTSFFQILFIPPNDLCQNVEKVHSTTYLTFDVISIGYVPITGYELV